MKKIGSAHWEGDLKEGSGTVSTESGALSAHSYGFKNRFEGVKGTNPEELIAAAHAACFSMALSLQLGEAGYTAKRIDTRATVSLDQVSEGFEITAIHLDLTADIPGIGSEEFSKIARVTKSACPVSKVLNAEISLDETLVS